MTSMARLAAPLRTLFTSTFVAEAYKHWKPVGATGAGRALLDAAGSTGAAQHAGAGVTLAATGRDAAAAIQQFITALGRRRFFMRRQLAQVSA